MNTQEFKAWFEGFVESMDDERPTKKQWERIRERVAEVQPTAAPMPYPVFVDRYVPHYPYWHWPVYQPLVIQAASAVDLSSNNFQVTDTIIQSNDGIGLPCGAASAVNFTAGSADVAISHSMFAELGRADFASVQ